MYACQTLKWLIEEESGKNGIEHAVSIGMVWEDIWFFVKQSQKRFIFFKSQNLEGSGERDPIAKAVKTAVFEYSL